MATRTRRARFAERASLMGALFVLILGAGCGADAPSAKPASPAPAAKADLPRQTIDLGGGVTFEMVLIPAGEFDMGSPETEEGHDDSETLHRVRITKPYWLARTEVTQAVWTAVMGSNPTTRKGPTLPMTNVSWDDCQGFLKRLNEKVAGGGYRLPTEAEWECACRAGSGARYCFGEDRKTLAEYAWFNASSEMSMHAVGLLRPNAWGLFDMHGNVWEWCQDWYGKYPSGAVTDPAGASRSGDRVVRGGGWSETARHARSADRVRYAPGLRNAALGFRLAKAVTVAEK